MKILLASSSFNGGGITSYALELINCFSIEHEFYLMIGETNGFIKERTFQNIIYENMDDLSIENANRVVNIINELNPDVLIISFAKVVGLIAPFLSNRIHIISVSHSLRYDESDIAAFQAPFIDHIIALSEYNKAYIKKRFRITDNNKIHVIYNFVKPTIDSPSITEKLTLSHEPIIVFAGGGAPSKTPELVHTVLLKLLKTQAKFRFYWLGNTNPPLKKIQSLKKIEQIVPDDSRVFFTGKIPRSQAASILCRANIILTPSRREGCPMSMLEAMSSGVIVMTSDYKNGCREIVEQAKCGVVISHNQANQFVKAILDIINNPTKYDNYYVASKNFYESTLSFEAWKSKMNKLIQNKCFPHSTRKPFSKNEYANILKQWKKCCRFNAIHSLLFETVPSAIAFMLKTIFCKHYEYHKSH